MSNAYFNHLGEPITLLRQSNRKTHPIAYAKQGTYRPTGVVEDGAMHVIPILNPRAPQLPTKWVKRRKLITAANPEGVERGPSRMKALPHNLAKRPLGRRPTRG